MSRRFRVVHLVKEHDRSLEDYVNREVGEAEALVSAQVIEHPTNVCYVLVIDTAGIDTWPVWRALASFLRRAGDH